MRYLLASEESATLAAKHLRKSDPVLAPLIDRFGVCTVRPHSNYYQELVDSIISQQLSVKAARSIEARFCQLFGSDSFPSAEQILSKNPEEFRAAGLSRAKSLYVHDLARHVVEGKLIFNAFPELSNEEITRELIAVKGIGEWTAHMFLLFCMGRLDVLPVGDLGIRTGIMRLYKLPELPSAEKVRSLATQNKWNPYESVASWYIWQSLDNTPK